MLQLTQPQPASWQAYAPAPAAPRFMPAHRGDVSHDALIALNHRQLVGPGGRCEIHRRDPQGHGHVFSQPELALYGLIPSWAYDARCATQNCIAPMGSVANKPAYRAALRKAQFCWTTASFFVGSVWREGREQIVHVERADHEPLYLAGLWSEWQVDHGQPLLSFSLFTRDHDEALKSQSLRIGHGLAQCYALLEPSQLMDWLSQSGHSAFEFLLSNPIPPVELHHHS